MDLSRGGRFERLRVGALARDLWTDGKGPILVSVAAGWLLSIGVRHMYPVLLPFFRTSFDLDLTTAGLLLTVLWLGYGLGQFPGGVLADRFGEGKILTTSTAVSAVGLLLVSLTGGIPALFVGTVLFGFATALFGPTRFTIFTDVYPDRAGTAVGLTYAAGSIGNAILPVVAVILASAFSWRSSIWVLLPLFVVVTLSIRASVPSRTSTVRGDDVSLWPARRLFDSVRRPGVPVAVAVQLLVVFVTQGFLGFFPIYLIEFKRLAPAVAATIFGIYFAIGIVVQPLTGFSMDRFGSRPTAVALCGLFALGLFLIQVVSSLAGILLVTTLLSARGGVGVVTNTFIAGRMPSDLKGSGLGLLRTGWIILASTGPVVIGALGDRGLLQQGYLLMAGLITVATLVSLRLSTESAPA